MFTLLILDFVLGKPDLYVNLVGNYINIILVEGSDAKYGYTFMLHVLYAASLKSMKRIHLKNTAF